MHHNGGNYTFTNDQYHYQDQSWMHPSHTAQDNYAQHLQTQWFEQQQADRMHQIYMQTQGGNWADLQAAANQASHPHHHNGPGWGTVAAVGTLAYLAARNRQRGYQQPWQRQPIVQRPEGWKGDVWGWYVLLGLFLHFIVANLIVGDSVGVAVFFLVIGSAIWVPLWVVGYRHQDRIWKHNSALERAALN